MQLHAFGPPAHCLRTPVQASAPEQLRLQGQASGAMIGSLSLAPSSLLSPAPSAGALHHHLAHQQQNPDAGAAALQGLSQALSQGLSQGCFAQSAQQLPPNVAALSNLARLAGGLAGLTAAAGAAASGPEAPPQQAFAGQGLHPIAGDERTATNVPNGRPAALQARFANYSDLPAPCDALAASSGGRT